MTQWDIKSDETRNKEAIAQWGQEEWTNRMKIVQTKRDELEKEFGWNENCVIGSQFESIARAAKPELWKKLSKSPTKQWRELVLRIAS